MGTKTYEPTDQELISWVGTWNTEEEVNRAGYHFGADPATNGRRVPVPGEVVVVSSHGKFRRGIVTSVGRLRAAVTLVTPTAIKNARDGYKIYMGEPTGWQTSHEMARTQAGGPVRFSLIGMTPGATELVDGSFVERDNHGKVPAALQLTSESVQDGAKIDAPAGQDDAADIEKDSASENTGSSVVKVLERLWQEVRANHPELPPVVIVTGSGFVGPARWGHFRAEGWTDRVHSTTQDGVTTNAKLGEMFVAGETLAKGADHTVETVLHEGAHVLARVRNIQDTSRQKRWHNQKFRSLAEEMGLEHLRQNADPQHGFSECVLTPGTREEYAEVIEELDKAIRMHIDIPGFMGGDENGRGSGGEFIPGTKKGRGQATQNTNNIKATCGCSEPRIIRASRKVLDQGFIACGICHQGFQPEDEKPEPTSQLDSDDD